MYPTQTIKWYWWQIYKKKPHMYLQKPWLSKILLLLILHIVTYSHPTHTAKSNTESMPEKHLQI